MTGSGKIGRTVKIGIAVVFSGAAVLASAGPSTSEPGMPALDFTGGHKPVHVIVGWHDTQTSHAQ